LINFLIIFSFSFSFFLLKHNKMTINASLSFTISIFINFKQMTKETYLYKLEQQQNYL
jgi:hypothetical protein